MPEAFQVVCVERSQTNWGHRHITGIGTAPKPGAPERWPMATVIGRLAGGDLFYVVSALGEPIFCQRYRCWCGTESLRTTADEGALEPLEALESCDWEQGSAERALPPFTIALDRRQLGSSTRG
jgi:hypothetical protein